MRAANHHGRGKAKHNGRYGFDAPHIDRRRSKSNQFWTLVGGFQPADKDGGCSWIEEDERACYKARFSAGVEAQNERYRARRQYKKLRTVDQVYENRMTQPEESLLYIGDKRHLGEVAPGVLWDCVWEYVQWEQAYSKAHGEFYIPLSLALHADERGQIHVHERGVYEYQEAGSWRVGQAAALEAAGFPLPDPDAERSADNNRKQVWDAMRREKWLDIVEAHGFTVQREPEADRPHLPLAAWQYLQDELQKVEEGRREVQAEREAQEAAKARITALEGQAEADRAEAASVLQKAREDGQRAAQAAGAAVARLGGMKQAEYDKGFMAYSVKGHTISEWIGHWDQEYRKHLQAEIEREANVRPVRPKPKRTGKVKPAQKPAPARPAIPSAEEQKRAIAARAAEQREAERRQGIQQTAGSIWDALEELPPLDPDKFREVP